MQPLATVLVLSLLACGEPTASPTAPAPTGTPAAPAPSADAEPVLARRVSGGFAGGLLADLRVFPDGRVELRSDFAPPAACRLAPPEVQDLVSAVLGVGFLTADATPRNERPKHVADGTTTELALAAGPGRARRLRVYALGEAPDAYAPELHRVDALLAPLVAAARRGGLCSETASGGNP